MASTLEDPETIFEHYAALAQDLFNQKQDVPPMLQGLLMSALPADRQRFSLFLYLLGSYKETRRGADLDQAIKIGQHLVYANPDVEIDNHTRALRKTLVAQAFQSRFERAGASDDLQSAISLRKESISLRGNAGSTQRLDETSLCANLKCQFELVKDHKIISDAIAHGRSALRKTPDDDPQRPLYLSNLAAALQVRFNFFGVEEDGDQSIELLRSALLIAESNHWDATQLSLLQNNLSSSLQGKLRRTRRRLDVTNECVELMYKSVASTPPHGPDIYVRRLNLACVITERFCATGNLADIDDAVGILEELLSDGKDYLDTIRVSVMDTLGVCLMLRYEKSGSVDDLDRSIHVGKRSLGFQSEGDGLAKLHIAMSHWHRFRLRGEETDLDEALELFSKITNLDHMTPYLRFGSACMSARTSHYQGRYEDALQAYRDCLTLLPQLLLVGKSYRIDAIIGYGAPDLGLDAAACCIACGKPELAVEMLEHGRSVGWTRSLHMRGDFDQLKTDHPEYARRLVKLGDLLEGAEIVQTRDVDEPLATDMAPWEHSFGFSRLWDELLAEIRTLDGYRDFLLPAKFSALGSVGQCGPLAIVNISTYRCDALILSETTLDRPQVIPLERRLEEKIRTWYDALSAGTERFENRDISEAEFNQSVLSPILEGLWNEIANPVREALKGLVPYARRIWWCPTGRLTFLPLHVVTNGPNMPNIDFPLIPSYTTTLSSLLRARSRPPSIITESGGILAVSCQTAEGYEDLPGADCEISALRAMIPSDRMAILRDEDAQVNRVLSGLVDHGWAHLACHGNQDYEKPFRSHFVLHDGQLHMSDIIAQKLPTPEFAFLSACNTAAGLPALHDEAMHLAAALHFVGFRGTIATQWSVDDYATPRLAQKVYSHLFRKRPPRVEDAAEALYYGVLAMRGEGLQFSRLASFIHIGV